MPFWEEEKKKAKPIDRKKIIAKSLKELPDIPFVERFEELPKSGKKYKDLNLNAVCSIDASTAKKIDKGLYPIDGILDLHEKTQIQAFDLLQRFIESHYQKQSRLLLVISGKGSVDGVSVLREMIPKWINLDSIRPMIVRISQASRKHGGDGAYYVFLRRVRKS